MTSPPEKMSPDCKQDFHATVQKSVLSPASLRHNCYTPSVAYKQQDDVIMSSRRTTKYGNSSKLVQALLADSERLKMSPQLRSTKVIHVSEFRGTETSAARSRNVAKGSSRPAGCRRSRKYYNLEYIMLNFED